MLLAAAIRRYRPMGPPPTAVGGGRAIQIVSSAGLAYDPALSPDGRMIAYAAETAEGVDLFVADSRGEGRVWLTQDAAREQQPRFSPDGTRLIFSPMRPGETTREICLIPVLGGQIVTIVERVMDPGLVSRRQARRIRPPSVRVGTDGPGDRERRRLGLPGAAHRRRGVSVHHVALVVARR